MDREINITRKDSESQISADAEALECEYSDTQEDTFKPQCRLIVDRYDDEYPEPETQPETVDDTVLSEDKAYKDVEQAIREKLTELGVEVTDDILRKVFNDYKSILRGALIDDTHSKYARANAETEDRWRKLERDMKFRDEQYLINNKNESEEVFSCKPQELEDSKLTDDELDSIKENLKGGDDFYTRIQSYYDNDTFSDSAQSRASLRKYKDLNNKNFLNLAESIVSARNKFKPLRTSNELFNEVLNDIKEKSKINNKPNINYDYLNMYNQHIGTQKSTLDTKDDSTSTTITDVFDGSTPYFDMTSSDNNIQYECQVLRPLTQKTGGRVDHPDYYNLEDGPYIMVDGNKINIECIDVIRDMPTWKGNVFKYLWRCGEKHEAGLSDREKELEDMKKALWYLQDKIKEMES